MKNLFLILSILVASATNAQVKKVSIQATGLTCSMCSNAINKALKSLDFVQNVDANIKNSTFEVTFKPNADVDFDKLKNKVEDAGFFVADFRAVIHFNDVKVINNMPVNALGKNLMFLRVSDQELNGDKIVRFLDKGYISNKEFKKMESLTDKDCYKTGIANDSYTQAGIAKGSRLYHVTI